MRTLQWVPMVLLAGLAAAPTPAAAQAGNPAGIKPGTPQAAPGVPAAGEANTVDRLFVQLVGAGGMAEVDAGRLASGKAQEPGVKTFAQQMVQDHAAANERLADLARHARVPMPPGLDADHQAMRRDLESAPASRFDTLYLRGQLIDHQKTVHLLEWEIDNGQDADLQHYAEATLPTVLQHLQKAQQLWSATTGAPPQGLGTLPVDPMEPH